MSEIVDATPAPEWVLFLGKFLGLGLVLVACMALRMTAGDARSGGHGLSRFRDRAVPADPLRDSARRLPPLRPARPRGARRGESEAGRPPGDSHRLCAHGLRLRDSGSGTGCSSMDPIRGGRTRTCAASARRSGPGSGSSSTGRRGRCCSRWWRGCSGCGAGRAASGCGFGWHAGRFTRPTARVAAAAVGLILTVGGFIFYNTNVLNEYATASDRMERRVEYERRYGRYQGIPQPRLTGTSLHVEIYPDQRKAEIRGTYLLVNSNAVAIDSIHLATASEVETDSNPGSTGGSRARRRGSRPPDLYLGHAAPARRLAAARLRGAFRTAWLP